MLTRERQHSHFFISRPVLTCKVDVIRSEFFIIAHDSFELDQGYK